MSDERAERPRTWVPVAAAGGVAVLVLGLAFGWTLFTDGPSEVEGAMVEACESVYAETAGPAIVSGEIYEPDEMLDYYAAAETHGEAVPFEDLTEEQQNGLRGFGAEYAESGSGSAAVVWRLEDDTYAHCLVRLSGGAVIGTPTVGPLEVAVAE